MRIQQNNKIFRVTQKDRVPPVKAEVAGLSPAPEKQTHCYSVTYSNFTEQVLKTFFYSDAERIIMKDFMFALKAENDTRKTLTENGALAYETTGKEILDFNFRLSSYRRLPEEECQRDFARVYYENQLLAIKFLFWVGDIRGGAGERKAFRVCLLWLADHQPEIAKAVLSLVPEYNRYDSLLPLLDTDLREFVSSKLMYRIAKDKIAMSAGEPISLCAKWCPSLGASSPTTRRYAKVLCRNWGVSEKEYRQTLSKLRKYLDVVERKMSAKQWGDIDYSKVPSKANLIYNEAFLRNDEDRRREYLGSLKRGETKINAGVLQPHEIVARYTNWFSAKNYDETLEQLWKNLPDMTVSNTLVIRDGSGSMNATISPGVSCLSVATALTIYLSEHNTGSWKDKFITFSSNPEIVDLSNEKTLHDKVDKMFAYDDCSNTDIYKTMNLILRTAVKNHMTQADMPEMIVICSDMQFDARYFNFEKTLFESIIEEYEAAGYKMPKICFWNINDRGEKTIPLQQNDLGLILCSGFSVQIMKMFMSNKLDPYEILLETINSPRYDAVEEAVINLI